jgi:hypothetical protein
MAKISIECKDTDISGTQNLLWDFEIEVSRIYKSKPLNLVDTPVLSRQYSVQSDVERLPKSVS